MTETKPIIDSEKGVKEVREPGRSERTRMNEDEGGVPYSRKRGHVSSRKVPKSSRTPNHQMLRECRMTPPRGLVEGTRHASRAIVSKEHTSGNAQ